MAPAAGQDEALVDALGRLLQLEDERRFERATLEELARSSEVQVRRRVALALGRVGDRAGTALAVELLRDADSTVQAGAAFALGLLQDPAAFEPLAAMVTAAQGRAQTAVHVEAVAALAKLGGSATADLFGRVLDRAVGQAQSDAAQEPVVDAVLLESWRLATLAPVAKLAPFAASPVLETRWRAVYTLARVRAAPMAPALLRALTDAEPLVRATAVRALVRSFALDSARLAPDAVLSAIRPLGNDVDPLVRIHALRTLATYRDTALTNAALDRLRDVDLNVRVEAVTALGSLGGRVAVRQVLGLLDGQRWAIRRAALLALAEAAGAEFDSVVALWAVREDWRERFTAADALGARRVRFAAPQLLPLLDDRDPRVAARALEALGEVLPASDTTLLGAARRLLARDDAVIRSVAADRLGAAPDLEDVPRLTDAYRRAQGDQLADGRLSAVRALGAIARASPAGLARVSAVFLDAVPPPEDYLVLRMAEERLPMAAQRWGPSTPVRTGRGLEDYRDVARRLLMSSGTPTVTIESERGSLVVELFAADAPLTVDHFLKLVDRRFFDGGAWHRVVPGFVAQDGDPRGDGWGGPGLLVRDEINLRRYESGGVVGVALSGPDTGGSQFFITLSPQPHLDGVYTVFGRVVSDQDVLHGVTQGDRIRRVRR